MYKEVFQLRTLKSRVKQILLVFQWRCCSRVHTTWNYLEPEQVYKWILESNWMNDGRKDTMMWTQSFTTKYNAISKMLKRNVFGWNKDTMTIQIEHAVYDVWAKVRIPLYNYECFQSYCIILSLYICTTSAGTHGCFWSLRKTIFPLLMHWLGCLKRIELQIFVQKMLQMMKMS